MIRSRHSRRSVPITRSQTAFARGARTGVLMPWAANTASKDAVNLVSPIPEEELDRASLLGKLHAEVAGLMCHPVGDRLGGHTGDPHEARVVVDEDEHLQPPEKHRVDGQEVAREQARGLRSEELRLGGPRPPG